MEKEVRTITLNSFEVRTQDNENIIEGHAAVFDSFSEDLGTIYPFKEKIRKGAFTKSIAEDDIRALFNHDPNFILGRNKAKTLFLNEDKKGLYVRIHPPNTLYASDLLECIKRGDITQMSFGFIVQHDEWTTENDIDIRELIEVKLFDISPVTFPAYTQTDVYVRAMDEYKNYIENKNLKVRNLLKEQNNNKLNYLKNKMKFM